MLNALEPPPLVGCFDETGRLRLVTVSPNVNGAVGNNGKLKKWAKDRGWILAVDAYKADCDHEGLKIYRRWLDARCSGKNPPPLPEESLPVKIRFRIREHAKGAEEVDTFTRSAEAPSLSAPTRKPEKRGAR